MRNPSRHPLIAAALLSACLAAPPALAQDTTLERARTLITAQKGQGRGAYELLAPLEAQRAGEAPFDYLLGVAAIDAGEFTRAVFALERVLAVEPNHPQARAEIARAYFLMGENRAARQEFEAVKATKPPAEAVATIDRFLNALDERQRGIRSGVSGFLEAGIGHDSNANAAASGSGLAIPGLPGFGFNPNRRSDTFRALAGGINGRYVIGPGWTLFGGGSFNQRYNNEVDRFDTGTYGLDGGVVHQRGANEYSLAVQTQAFDLDHARFRDATGAVAQWRYSLSNRQQVSAYAQLARLTYPSASLRNAHREVLGVAWASALQGAWAPAVYAGLYAGRERTMSGNVAEFGHQVIGLRGGGQMSLRESLTAFVNLNYEERRYGNPENLNNPASLTSFFPFARKDREYGVRVGLNYQFAGRWSVSPSVAYTDNQSNVSVSAYRRAVFLATLRYDFR